jgi:hypothetical protein
MPNLSFRIEDAGVVPFAVAPTLMFKLHIENATPGEMIHTIALRCQIQIEATRRRYTQEEQGRMRISSASPTAGAKPFTLCFGRMSILLFLVSRAAHLLTFLSPAHSTSM